ncbi:hypothetical protein DTO207G8_396 [Paecilomyces variotii]|nr:hypothetical protein DTO207G8_396 [Paecilomyces variotii]
MSIAIPRYLLRLIDLGSCFFLSTDHKETHTDGFSESHVMIPRCLPRVETQSIGTVGLHHNFVPGNKAAVPEYTYPVPPKPKPNPVSRTFQTFQSSNLRAFSVA